MESKTRVTERGFGKAQKELGEVGRATAKDTTGQGKQVDIFYTNVDRVDERTRIGTSSLGNG